MLIKRLIATTTLLALGSTSYAQGDDAAALEMARKAQDPLGNVKALMTDNAISFDGGPNDDTTYAFQFQPVYAIDNETRFNFLARAIIPVIGVEPGVVLPPLGPDPRPPADSTWGISDSIFQFFISPKTDGAWKWGVGPQVSLKTRTSDRLAGAGNGVGIAGVVFGGVGNWGLGTLFMQHWGEGNYEIMTVQPIVMYNFESMPGAYLGYNNAINYNWNATSGNRLTVPIGLTGGKTILLGNGDGLDLNLGAYGMLEKPADAPQWQVRFGISYYFN